jgi:EAL domain-containing protein (putative c-di-GMP-specific phosphodiesterase class I)
MPEGMNPTTQPLACCSLSAPARVLLVDDDELVLKALRREIRRLGYQVDIAATAHAALERVSVEPFDLVVTDINLGSEESGISLMQSISARGLDVPIILLTGMPEVETAMRAIELGAKRYLSKPVHGNALREAVVRAVEEARLERKRKSGSYTIRPDELHFARAMGKLRMAYQPIVSYRHQRVFAYEALVRCSEPGLERPPEILHCAESLGRLHALGRRIRALVASAIEQLPKHQRMFVNLHTADLSDPDLYDPHSPLSAHAERTVLEITERACLDEVSDLPGRLERLRRLGYVLAVDDMGAGYSGLTSFVKLRPEIVKIDMSLVGGIHKDATLKRVVGSLLDLCLSAGALTVVEGVECGADAETLRRMGAEFMQGYAFARPEYRFADVSRETFEALAGTEKHRS